MAGAVDLTASMGGGGGGLDPLIAALDRYSGALQTVAGAVVPVTGPTIAPGAGRGGDFDAIVEAVDDVSRTVADWSNQIVQTLTGMVAQGQQPQPMTIDLAPLIDSVDDVSRTVASWSDAVVQTLAGLNSHIAVNLEGLGDRVTDSIDKQQPQQSQPTPTPNANPSATRSAAPQGIMDVVAGVGKALKNVNVWAYALEKSLAQLGKLVDIALKPVGDFIALIGDALTPVAEVIADLIKMGAGITLLTPIIKILGKVLQVLAVPFKVLASVMGALSDVVELVLLPFETLADGLLLFGDMLTSSIGALGLFGKSAKTAQNSITDGFNLVKKNIEKVVTDPFNAVPALIGQIRGAVETLNPGVMVEFDLTMRDLTAVFGQAFIPIIGTATKVLRELAETLYPIFQRLAPLFETMTAAIGDTLINNIQRLADAFERMMPAIQAYLNSQIYAAERTALIAAQYYKTESTMSRIGSWFANWFRTNKQIENSIGGPLRREREGPGKTVGLAAATNPAFKSIQDLTRESLMAAFVATSSQAQTKEKQNARAVNNVADLPVVIEQAAKNAFIAAMKAGNQQQVGVAAPAGPAFPRP